MAESELELRVTYDGRTVVRELKHTDEELKQMRDDAVAAGGAASEAFEEAGDEAGRAATRARGLRRQLDELDGTSVEMDADLDASEVRRQIKSIEDEEVDVDVEADRRRGRGGGLPTDPEEVLDAFQGLPPQIQGLIAAVLTASAALAGGAGLAAAATVLADKLGSDGIQDDLDQLKARFRGVGVELATEFEPVIRNHVIPAAEDLADAINENSEELADFADRAMQILTEGEVQGSPGSQVSSSASAFQDLSEGRFMTPDSPLGRLLGLQEPLVGESDAPSGGDLADSIQGGLYDAQNLFPSDQALQGFRQKIKSEIIQPAMNEIAAIRGREDAGLISPKEEKKKIKEVRNTLDMELRKAKAKAPNFLFPDDLLDQNLRKLRKVGAELEDMGVPEDFQSMMEAGDIPTVRPDNRKIEQEMPDLDASLDLEVNGLSDARAMLQGGLLESINAADDAIQALQKQFNNATTDQARQEIQALINKLRAHRDEMLKTKQRALDLGPALEEGMADAIGNFAEGIGEMLVHGQDAENIGTKILQTLASLAQRIGKMMIGFGTAALALESLITNPVTAIAAGTALVALGAAAKAAISDEISGATGGGRGRGGQDAPREATVPEMASGGRVTGGGIALVGEEGPEAVHLPSGAEVMPNDTTQTMLNALGSAPPQALGGQSSTLQDVVDRLQEVERSFMQKQFRLRGKDLETSQARQEALYDDAGIK
jgi:hypothetical protein